MFILENEWPFSYMKFVFRFLFLNWKANSCLSTRITKPSAATKTGLFWKLTLRENQYLTSIINCEWRHVSFALLGLLKCATLLVKFFFSNISLFRRYTNEFYKWRLSLCLPTFIYFSSILYENCSNGTSVYVWIKKAFNEWFTFFIYLSINYRFH